MAINKRFLIKNGLDNNSQTITNVADPVNAQDAATKNFASNASNITTGTLPATVLPASGVTSGTYNTVTVDAYGRITSASTVTPPNPLKNNVFFENDAVVTSNYTITSGKNAMSAGPVTVSNGINVTIPDGSSWSIV